MWYDTLHGRIPTVDRNVWASSNDSCVSALSCDITVRCITIINRADDTLLEYMQYYVNRCDLSCGETYRLGKEFGQKFIEHTAVRPWGDDLCYTPYRTGGRT